MGKRLVSLSSQDQDLRLVAALEHAQHPQIGQDAGIVSGFEPIGVTLAASLGEAPQVLIDFSVADAVPAIVTMCTDMGIPLVMATTGMDAATQHMIRTATSKIPVVMAPNMSLAVNLTMKMAALAATALKDHSSGVDVEVMERHHRYKEDAPSGTALKFGELLAGIMGQTTHVHGREGRPGQRPRSEIGYHALRVGDNPGEHTIVLGMLGETIELTVRATNRDCYAMGALEAAKFAAKQQPGMYSMFDVLGL